jgi:hypothetical protein
VDRLGNVGKLAASSTCRWNSSRGDLDPLAVRRDPTALRRRSETAFIASLAWWFIVTLGDITWCSFGLFPVRTVIPLMIGALPALVVATLIGARVYHE